MKSILESCSQKGLNQAYTEYMDVLKSSLIPVTTGNEFFATLTKRRCLLQTIVECLCK